MNIFDSVIVSVDFSNKDNGVLLVGRQKNGHVDMVNGFMGEEALELYKKLTTVKKQKNGEK